MSLAAGEEHCAAVTAKGNVYVWGQGCFGKARDHCIEVKIVCYVCFNPNKHERLYCMFNNRAALVKHVIILLKSRLCVMCLQLDKYELFTLKHMQNQYSCIYVCGCWFILVLHVFETHAEPIFRAITKRVPV